MQIYKVLYNAIVTCGSDVENPFYIYLEKWILEVWGPVLQLLL